jgi:hypothetical protein
MRVQIDPHADLRAVPQTLYWGERRIEIIEVIDVGAPHAYQRERHDLADPV